MLERTFKILDYNKILNMLQEIAINDEAKNLIANIKPINDMDEINDLLNKTDAAIVMSQRFGLPPLISLTNPLASIKRAKIGSTLCPTELLNVHNILSTVSKLKTYFDKSEHFLTEYSSKLVLNKTLDHEISTVIVSKDEISDEASSQLKAIRRKITKISYKTKENLNSFITSPRYVKYIQQPVVTMRGGRYVIPVKCQYKNEIKGIVHDVSSSGLTVFIEPEKVINLNNIVRQLEIDESNEIERILKALSLKVAEFAEPILLNFNTIINLDVIFAKAKLAESMQAQRPIVNDNGIVDIRAARHPLLKKETVVPIDIQLGKNFDTLIITGPNTGGKTVALKTIGLFCLMAQSGLFVPAKGETNDCADIAVFDNVYADIGDEQSIEQNLSTFSSHMKNIIYILGQITSNSLLLLDELSTGTDPTEGAALASALLELIREKGAKVVVTTHYTELKLYAMSTAGVENASCDFDVRTLSPTYKLLIGSLGKSSAFEISAKLGLDTKIINRAKTLLSEKSIKFDNAVEALERGKKEAQEKLQQIEIANTEIQDLKKQAQLDNNFAQQQITKIVERVKLEQMEILQKTKEYVENLLEEITDKIEKNADISAQRSVVEDVKRRLNIKLKCTNEKCNNKENFVPKDDIKVGDAVFVSTIGEQGKVISLNKKEGKAQIIVGNMKITTDIAEVVFTKTEKKKEKSPISFSNKDSFLKTPKTELDLRGMTLQEAIQTTDKFLDDALLSRLHSVNIIHGKGTGVLRSGVHSLLKNYKHVKSFRLGEYGEGDVGVTIVYFE